MNETLTTPELNEINDIELEYGNAIFDLGYISLNIENLKKKLSGMEIEKDNILSKINEIDKRQHILLDKLTSKYGDKILNIKTGELSY